MAAGLREHYGIFPNSYSKYGAFYRRSVAKKAEIAVQKRVFSKEFSMNWMFRIVFAVLLTFSTGISDAYAACGDCPGDAHHEKAEKDGKDGNSEKAVCSCKAGKDGASTWCGHCGVGYHEGKKMKCEGCYKKATGESKEGCTSCSSKAEPETKEG